MNINKQLLDKNKPIAVSFLAGREEKILLSDKGLKLGQLLLECSFMAQKAWIGRSVVTTQAKGRTTETMDFFTDLDAELDNLLVLRTRAELGVTRFLTEEGKENSARNSIGGKRAVIDPLDGSSNFASYRPDIAISVAVEEDGRVLLAGIATPIRGELILAERGSGVYFLSFYGKSEGEVRLRRDLARANAAMFSLPQKKLVANPLESSRIYVHTGRRRNFELGPDDSWNRLYAHLANPVCYLSCAIALIEVALGKVEGLAIGFQNYWDFAAGRLIVSEAGGNFEAWDLGWGHKLSNKEIAEAYAVNQDGEEWQSHILAAGSEDVLDALRAHFIA